MSEADSITDDFCTEQKTAFGDTNSFADRGGLAGMGESLEAGMVLVMVSLSPRSPIISLTRRYRVFGMTMKLACSGWIVTTHLTRTPVSPVFPVELAAPIPALLMMLRPRVLVRRSPSATSS